MSTVNIKLGDNTISGVDKVSIPLADGSAQEKAFFNLSCVGFSIDTTLTNVTANSSNPTLVATNGSADLKFTAS